MARRIGAGLAGGLIAITLLSGCMRAHMDFTLQPDNTIDGSVVVAVSEALGQAAGEDFTQSDEYTSMLESPSLGGVTEPYAADGYVGVKETFTDLPLADFAASGTNQPDFRRDGDTFVVSGSMDWLAQEIGMEDWEHAATGPGMAGTAAGSLDVRFSVTFPGRVIEQTGGEVSGNTVTWTAEAGKPSEIYAVGAAVAGGGGPSAWLIGIIVGFVVAALAGLIVVLVLRARRKPAPVGPVDPAEPVNPTDHAAG